MHKALDRIKFLKKKQNTVGAPDAGDLDNDEFASIEARVNPRDARVEPKASGRKADGVDALSDPDRRAGTAGHLFQNAHL